MALNVTNFMMRHSVKVSTMPNMSKSQNHVSYVVVVSAISSAKPILAAAGLPEFTNKNAKRPPREVIGERLSEYKDAFF